MSPKFFSKNPTQKSDSIVTANNAKIYVIGGTLVHGIEYTNATISIIGKNDGVRKKSLPLVSKKPKKVIIAKLAPQKMKYIRLVKSKFDLLNGKTGDANFYSSNNSQYKGLLNPNVKNDFVNNEIIEYKKIFLINSNIKEKAYYNAFIKSIYLYNKLQVRPPPYLS